MRLPRWLHPLIVLALLAVAAPYAAAQDKLPAKMVGNWSGITRIKTQDQPISGNWSVVIDKQNPDGTVEAKATWSGFRSCEMNDEPMSGKFDGNELRLEGMFRDKYPNAKCGKAVFVLRKSGPGFEGEIPASRQQIKLTLKPS